MTGRWPAPRLAAGLWLAALAAGCAPLPRAGGETPPAPIARLAATGPACPAGTQRMLVAELFFGRAIGAPRPGRVSEGQWHRFVADTLASALPDGFTVRDATGTWRDPASGHVVTEATKDVVAALSDRAGALAALRRAIGVYRRRFRQQSVGLLLNRECGAF